MHPTTLPRWVPWALAALTLAVRLPWLGEPAIGDELAVIVGGSVDAPWDTPENRVNPPLQRVLLGALPPDARLLAGRLAAWLGHGLAVAGLVVLASRRGATPGAAAAVGACFALSPGAVEAGALARVYGPMAAAMVGLVLALDAAVRRPASVAPRVVVAVLAGVLPWVHHLAVPWLAVLAGWAALRSRGLLPWLAPAALSALATAAVALRAPAWSGALVGAEPLRQVGDALTGGIDPWFVAVPLGIALGWPLVRQARDGDPVAASALAWVAAIALASPVRVRPIVASLALAVVLPAAIAAWQGRPRGRALLWTVAAAHVVTGIAGVVERPGRPDIAALADALVAGSLDAVPLPGDAWVRPDYRFDEVAWAVAERGVPCGPERCRLPGGRALVRGDGPGVGVVVTLHEGESPVEGQVVASGPRWRVVVRAGVGGATVEGADAVAP